MPQYTNDLKKKLCEKICIHGASTIKTAQDFNVPLKTLEKWITSFNKNIHCFDIDKNSFSLVHSNNNSISYDDMSPLELKEILMKKDIEISRLKKGYMVKGGGTEKKEFIIFSTKNTK